MRTFTAAHEVQVQHISAPRPPIYKINMSVAAKYGQMPYKSTLIYMATYYRAGRLVYVVYGLWYLEWPYTYKLCTNGRVE